MNHDDLFRQALQRQNDRAAGMKMPDNMEQRVKDRIKSKNNSRRLAYSASIVAVAASVLLLLTLHYKGSNTEPDEKPLTAQKTEQRDSTKKVGDEPTIGQEQQSYAESEKTRLYANERPPVKTSKMPVVVQDTQVRHDSTIKNLSAVNAKPTPGVATDQLNDYIARLEAEMEALDDSVRSAHLEKIIAADVRLQQLVNRIVKDEAEQAKNELQKDSTANYINF